MEILKHINDMLNTYTIANLLGIRAIVVCSSKEEFLGLVFKINCTSYLCTAMDEGTWDINSSRDSYKGSIGVLFNKRHVEYCFLDYYKERIDTRHNYYSIYRYSDIILV